MNRKNLPLMSFVFLLFLTACSVVENPVEPPTYSSSERQEVEEGRGGAEIEESEDNPMAIVEYHGVDFSQEENLANYSRAKLLVVNPYVVWSSNSNPSAIADMKSRNQSLKVIGYFNSQTSWVKWGENDGPAEGTYEYDWGQATREFWSYTTTGDTMMAWPGKVVLNILNPDCRAAMVDVISNHWNAHENVYDGIFWDHFNTHLWVKENVAGRVGEMDLDGDGVPHLEDEDEMQAYRDASVSLIQEIRSALGANVIQVANGNRAASDIAFAGVLDGTMYEHFPQVGFASGGERQALDPGFAHNLFAVRERFIKTNGGPYVILSNTFSQQVENEDGSFELIANAEFCRVVALMSDNLVSYHSGNGQTTYGWPEVSLDLGTPLSPVQFEGNLVTRDFENGTIEVDFSQGSGDAPFGFRVLGENQLLMEFSPTR